MERALLWYSILESCLHAMCGKYNELPAIWTTFMLATSYMIFFEWHANVYMARLQTKAWSTLATGANVADLHCEGLTYLLFYHRWQDGWIKFLLIIHKEVCTYRVKMWVMVTTGAFESSSGSLKSGWSKIITPLLICPLVLHETVKCFRVAKCFGNPDLCMGDWFQGDLRGLVDYTT
jgi:hypothetical protein